MIISDVSSANGRQPVADLIETIKRRKLMLTLPIIAGVGVGFAGYLTAPVSYVSESVLVLDMRRLQALPNESAITPLPQDSPVLRSELDIINSRMMAQRSSNFCRRRISPCRRTCIHARFCHRNLTGSPCRRMRAISIRQYVSASRLTCFVPPAGE